MPLHTAEGGPIQRLDFHVSARPPSEGMVGVMAAKAIKDQE
jgi:hypothetical protein